jgi:hypothetical protein
MQRQAILYGSFFGILALVVGVAVVLPAAAGSLTSSAGSKQAATAVAAGASDWRKSPRPKQPAGGSGEKHRPLMADAGTSPYCKWNQLYLPPIALPDHYDLEITSDLRSRPYEVSGSVRIRLQPLEDVTPCIVLHSKGIKISSVQLIMGDEEAGDLIPGEVANSTEYEQVVLKFDEAVPLAPAVVSSGCSVAGFAAAGFWEHVVNRAERAQPWVFTFPPNLPASSSR